MNFFEMRNKIKELKNVIEEEQKATAIDLAEASTRSYPFYEDRMRLLQELMNIMEGSDGKEEGNTSTQQRKE